MSQASRVIIIANLHHDIPEPPFGFYTVGDSGLDVQSWSAAYHRCCSYDFNFNKEVAVNRSASEIKGDQVSVAQ